MCMSEVISSFRSLRAGSQVFALLMLFHCVILHSVVRTDTKLSKSFEMKVGLRQGSILSPLLFAVLSCVGDMTGHSRKLI